MSGNTRYVYSVSIYDMNGEDLVLGEGSGPASHVIANLERLLTEIRIREQMANDTPIQTRSARAHGTEVGKEFFQLVSAGKADAAEWPAYLLSQLELEMRAHDPKATDVEIEAALKEAKRSPEFGLAIQAGLSVGAIFTQHQQILDLRRVQQEAEGENKDIPGTRA